MKIQTKDDIDKFIEYLKNHENCFVAENIDIEDWATRKLVCTLLTGRKRLIIMPC